MHYTTYPNPNPIRKHIKHLCHHYDHLKALQQSYHFMRQQQTFSRLHDPHFTIDLAAANQLNHNYYTSLIIPLSPTKGTTFFAPLQTIYEQATQLITYFFPNTAVTTTLTSAHITIKTIVDGRQQNQTELQAYATIIRPIVHKWIIQFSAQTVLYALGLFSNLHPAKGFSLGVRFFPSSPLLQMIRGDVGHILYTTPHQLPLRPETAFHTSLIHSTGLRVRNLQPPFPPTFIAQLKQLIEQHDQTLFGSLNNLTLADFVIRNGRSDALTLGIEQSLLDLPENTK